MGGPAGCAYLHPQQIDRSPSLRKRFLSRPQERKNTMPFTPKTPNKNRKTPIVVRMRNDDAKTI